ncbi:MULTISPECIES: integrase core domain-containing protein [unclassified Acidovorax]|uniref:integrase core domain-containing protein n=1 Tax=unclassified Acidovorax TaxID=2684926 RepID=UPI001C445B85|nr:MULTISPECIES: integrase core domain-containing protein [unclassified Acidovorax]MBV7428365.1 transposase [Acidovorax sp. sif0732]MBV7449621.1 transposase [Acidovorax sp. sif0715]
MSNRCRTDLQRGSFRLATDTQPGQPTLNAYVGWFNKAYRNEVLDCQVSDSLLEASEMTADWLHRYDHHRPREALGQIPMIESVSNCPPTSNPD